MISHRSQSDSKSFQVSRILLSILTCLNTAVVWMVSTRPHISMSTSPCINPLVTVPRAPITIGITVTFMFQCFQFFNKVLGTYPSFRLLSVLHYGQPGQQSPQFSKFFYLSIFFFSFNSYQFGPINMFQ